jgi:hypothetical protein
MVPYIRRTDTVRDVRSAPLLCLEGVMLGTWLTTQRVDFEKGKLGQVRQERLELLGVCGIRSKRSGCIILACCQLTVRARFLFVRSRIRMRHTKRPWRKTAFESYRPQPPESNRAARAVRVIKQPKKNRVLSSQSMR